MYYCIDTYRLKKTFLDKNSNREMSATSGAGTVYTSGAPEFTPGF